MGIAVGSDVVCGSFDATWSNEAAWASAADTWALAVGMANAIAAIAPTSTPVYLFLMTTFSLPLRILSAISAAACARGESASVVRRLIGG